MARDPNTSVSQQFNVFKNWKLQGFGLLGQTPTLMVKHWSGHWSGRWLFFGRPCNRFDPAIGVLMYADATRLFAFFPTKFTTMKPVNKRQKNKLGYVQKQKKQRQTFSLSSRRRWSSLWLHKLQATKKSRTRKLICPDDYAIICNENSFRRSFTNQGQTIAVQLLLYRADLDKKHFFSAKKSYRK